MNCLSDDVVASRKLFLSNLTELFRLLLPELNFAVLPRRVKSAQSVLAFLGSLKMRLDSDTPAFVGDTNGGYHGGHVKRQA